MTLACNYDDYIDELKKFDLPIIELDFSRRDKNPLEALKAIWAIRKIVLSEQWEVVQTTTIKPNLYTAMACIGTNIRLYSMVTGLGVAMDCKRKSIKFGLFKILYRVIGAQSTKVFVQGLNNTSFLVRNDYVLEDKITTINGSGVDLDYFYKSEFPPCVEEVKLIFAGRLLKSKGVPDIVDLVREANVLGYKCSLKLFGRVEEASSDSITEEELVQFKNILGVSVESETKDIRKHIAQSHCLVLLTKYGEGIPKSLLEASSMQRVVLVSDADTCIELVKDNHNGYVLSEKNGKFSVDEFCSFLARRNEYQRVAKQARTVVEKSYSCNSVNKIIIDEYANI